MALVHSDDRRLVVGCRLCLLRRDQPTRRTHLGDIPATTMCRIGNLLRRHARLPRTELPAQVCVYRGTLGGRISAQLEQLSCAIEIRPNCIARQRGSLTICCPHVRFESLD